MKKVLILVLSIVMVVSMAVSAFAQAYPYQEEADRLPALTEESSGAVQLISAEDARDRMAEAKAKLEEACPQGFTVEYFFYIEAEGTVTVTFEPIPHEKILFKQFIDGEWVDLAFAVDGDGTITVEGITEGPMAIFVKVRLSDDSAAGARPSVGAKKEKLLPATVSTSVLHHSTEEVVNLSDDIQALMAEAKENLAEACPEGFAVKYFYYAQVIGSDGPAAAVYEAMDHSKIVVKLYVDGAWTELDVTAGEDGTITVDGIMDAPMAVFTK